jgi:hypothetical protein
MTAYPSAKPSRRIFSEEEEEVLIFKITIFTIEYTHSAMLIICNIHLLDDRLIQFAGGGSRRDRGAKRGWGGEGGTHTHTHARTHTHTHAKHTHLHAHAHIHTNTVCIGTRGEGCGENDRNGSSGGGGGE